MQADSNVLKFTPGKIRSGKLAARSGHVCEANTGDTRVKHADGLYEVTLKVCEHHRLVLESMFGLRLRSLKRRK